MRSRDRWATACVEKSSGCDAASLLLDITAAERNGDALPTGQPLEIGSTGVARLHSRMSVAVVGCPALNHLDDMPYIRLGLTPLAQYLAQRRKNVRFASKGINDGAYGSARSLPDRPVAKRKVSTVAVGSVEIRRSTPVGIALEFRQLFGPKHARGRSVVRIAHVGHVVKRGADLPLDAAPRLAHRRVEKRAWATLRRWQNREGNLDDIFSRSFWSDGGAHSGATVTRSDRARARKAGTHGGRELVAAGR